MKKRQNKKQAVMRAKAIAWLQREKLPHTTLKALQSAEHMSGLSTDGFDVKIGTFATSEQRPAKTITLTTWTGDRRHDWKFPLEELYAEALASMKPWKRERRIYFFGCENCGKDRRTFSRRRAKGKTCRSCRCDIPDPNQLPLFPAAQLPTASPQPATSQARQKVAH